VPFIEDQWRDHADADTCVPGDPDPTFRGVSAEDWEAHDRPRPNLCAALLSPAVEGGLDILGEHVAEELMGHIDTAMNCTRLYPHAGQHVATTGLSTVDMGYRSRVVATWTEVIDASIVLPEDDVMREVRDRLADALKPLHDFRSKAMGFCGATVRRLTQSSGNATPKTWTCTESPGHDGIHRAEWSNGSLAATWNAVAQDSLEPLGLTEYDSAGSIKTRM
jgi:hypothetical protein